VEIYKSFIQNIESGDFMLSYEDILLLLATRIKAAQDEYDADSTAYVASIGEKLRG